MPHANANWILSSDQFPNGYVEQQGLIEVPHLSHLGNACARRLAGLGPGGPVALGGAGHADSAACSICESGGDPDEPPWSSNRAEIFSGKDHWTVKQEFSRPKLEHMFQTLKSMSMLLLRRALGMAPQEHNWKKHACLASFLKMFFLFT